MPPRRSSCVPAPPSGGSTTARSHQMPDPFEALRRDPEEVQPDARFASRLRERIERALTLPKAVTVSHLFIEENEAPAATAPRGVVPYLAVAGAERAIDWYRDALGAKLQGEPIIMPDGRVGHSELSLAGAIFYLSEEHPE